MGVDWADAVSIEPGLQPVTKELLTHKLANRKDGACLDIMAKTFWGEIGNVHSLMYRFSTLCAKPLQHSPKPLLSEAGDGEEEGL